MKRNKMIPFVFALAVLAFCCLRPAEAAFTTVSSPQTGAWISSFPVATNYAFSTGRPLVMVWSSDNCGYCDSFKESISKSAFSAWQAEQPFVFCYIQGVDGKDTAANRGAKDFALDAGGHAERSGSYPMIALLWLDGASAKAAAAFPGRHGRMGVDRKSELYMEFIEAVETLFADYGASDLGFFPVSNTENDRFEAEASTGAVGIPIDRAVSGEVATNILSLYKGSTFLKSKEIVWGENDTRYVVTINLDDIDGLSYDGSSSLTMTLSSPTDGTSTNGAIHLVSDKKNSVTNPYFVGERTASDLDWADWTLDWDLVMKKVADTTSAGEKSYALAVFSGTLWCPYCKSIEETFFGSDKFAAWLRDNKVQLALFDQALSASDAYAGKGHLLTYSAGLDHFAGVEHKMTGGAAYLTRHGLAEDDEEVQAVVERTRRLTVDWLPPGSTSARLSNPTILLVDSEGAVLGRLNTWRDRNKVLGDDVRYYDPDENIARLDKLLELAEAGEQDDYPATTRLEHCVGTESSATLQVNSTKRYWNVVGASAGVLAVARTDDSSSPVTFTLYAGGAAVASGSGSLSVKLTSKILSSGGLQFGVSTTAFSSSVNPLVSDMSDGGTFDVSFATSFEPSTVVDNATLPMTFAASVVLEELDVEDGQRVSVRKSSGKIPTGLRVKYDKETKSVLLYGTPSRISEPVTFTYTVTLGSGREKEVLDPVEVTVAVFDPADANPYLGASRSVTVPLVGLDDMLAGTLTVSQSTKNRITAKYAGISKKTLTFSGKTWAELSDDGTVSLVSEKSGVTLELAMDANGNIDAVLSGVTSVYSDLVTGGTAVFSGSAKLGSDFTPFKGYYTAVLPTDAGGRSGTGYMTLNFLSSSYVKKGTVKYSVFMPNGRTLSGTSVLSLDPEDPDYAILPVLKRSSQDVISVLVRIQANGEKLYSDDETARIVLADDSVVPYWNHDDKVVAYSGTFDVFGGWYPQNTTVVEWLDIFEEQPTPFELAVVMPEEGVVSDMYGELVEVPSATLDVDDRRGFAVVESVGKMKMSFNKKTGLISGNGKLVFEDGKSLTGHFKGVLTPGWIDCGCGDDRVILPFGSGTFYYTDRLGKRTFKNYLRVELR